MWTDHPGREWNWSEVRKAVLALWLTCCVAWAYSTSLIFIWDVGSVYL